MRTLSILNILLGTVLVRLRWTNCQISSCAGRGLPNDNNWRVEGVKCTNAYKISIRYNSNNSIDSNSKHIICNNNIIFNNNNNKYNNNVDNNSKGNNNNDNNNKGNNLNQAWVTRAARRAPRPPPPPWPESKWRTGCSRTPAPTSSGGTCHSSQTTRSTSECQLIIY